MKKFTKVSLIIVAVIGGIGIILLGISSLMGAGYGTIRRMMRDGELDYGRWHIDGSGIYYGEDAWEEYFDRYLSDELDDMVDIDELDDWESTYGNNEMTENYLSFAYDATGIKDLEVDIDAAELIFKEGTDANQIVVNLYRGKEKYYEAEIEGDTLKIEYDIEHHHYYNNNPAKIVLEIPAGTAFEKLDFDIGAAAVNFDIKDVTCQKLDLDVGAGTIVADGFIVTEKMEVSIGAGNAEIKGGTYQNIDIECGVGEFSMKGTLKGNLDVDCGMGSIDIKLSGNETDYNYKLSCSVGSIVVNGSEYSSISGNHTENHPGAIGTIDLDCAMGDIDLEIR